MNPKKPLVEASRVTHSQKGMALVIVLAVLVLLAGLVVAFFSTVTSDAGSSAVSSNDARAKQLADSAVNLVMGQIVEATKGFKPGERTDANRLTWASQPGAIRTYDASGSAFQAFKLYSSPTMVSGGNLTFSSDLPTSSDATAIGAGNHSLFTDLNSPVMDAGGTLVFPIADPAALGSVEGFTVSNNSSLGTVTGNITQPRLLMPTRWLYMLKDGTLAAATTSGNVSTATVTGASATNPVVGRVAFWTDDETSKVNINTAGEGTYWDVPRLSFKEDWDFANFQPAQREFQRYPGHPAMTSLAPVFFATSNTTTGNLTQDQRNALYLVSPRIVGGGSNAGTAIATGALTPDSDRLYASVDELIFTANRTMQISDTAITANSTRQRAFFLTASSRAPEVTIFNTPRVSMWPITLTSSAITGNRTTTFDKLIAFCATINGNPYYFQRQDSLSPTNDWANILRNRQLLRYLQTLSDKPVPGFGASLVSKTTAADRDQLLVEMLDYIRSTNLYDDNLSPNTYDSQALADNAVQFTKGRISGSSVSSWTGHGVVAPLRVPAGLADGTISNNSTLMGFGRFHTISEAGLLFICNADGASGNLTAPKDGNGTAFLSANRTLNDGTLSGGNLVFSSNVTTTGGNVTINATQLAQMISNNTNNVTINYRLNTINSTTTEISSAATTYNGSRALGGTPLAPSERRIQAMLFFDYFVPMHGWTQYGMDGSMDVEIEGDMQINGQNIQMMGTGPGLRTETKNFDNQGMWGYHHWGANLGYRKIFANRNDAVSLTNVGTALVPSRGVISEDSNSTNVYRRYGLVSAPITVTVPAGANPTMAFTGPTSLRVKFYSRPIGSTPASPTDRALTRTASDLVQTIDLNFPSADFPIPVLKTTGSHFVSGASFGTLPQNWWTFNYDGIGLNLNGKPTSSGDANFGYNFGRLHGVSQRTFDSAGTLVQPSDTLRTLVPYHGDTRLVAGSHFVPAGVFQPSTFYYDTTRKDDLSDASTYASNGTNLALAPPQIQSYLTSSSQTYAESWLAHYRPAASDRLVSGAPYDGRQFPKFPGISVSNTDLRPARPFQQWGDFDNGVAYTADGPYINKPDEGNTARNVSGVSGVGVP
ncbi:MAG: Verru_Chthon cassette protein A, partial [Verrucomicrobia bacterium]|nr:Verru_Chthon cassette protein A [Verrucomicrobiota bacterium]